MGGPVGAQVTEPASAPIATAPKASVTPVKTLIPTADKPLDGLKTTVGAASGAAS